MRGLFKRNRPPSNPSWYQGRERQIIFVVVVVVVEVAVSGIAMIIVVLVAAGAIDADAVINCVVVGDVI